METSKTNLSGLVLEYDSGIIPPPYSHVFRLSLDWRKGDLYVELDLHYTDREDLTQDEILDEGFTQNDDYSYKGLLNSVWIKTIKAEFEKSKWSGKSLEEGGISINPIENSKETKAKIPANQEEWQLIAQDLIQAIYETTKKEAPLTVHYRQVDNETSLNSSITIHFSTREVLFDLDGKSRTINWEYAIQLMKLIFTPDYNYEIAKTEPGKKRGAYIECGDGYWHELGKGVVNIDPSYDAVSKIREGFEGLMAD
jgi:hypothetical protein